MLEESAARWLLVLHTAIGVAAVGATTHLVLWLRRYVRGQFGKRRAVRRFAYLALALQGAAFLVGNIMYPTYKVEVRTAYLENPTAVGAQETTKDSELARIAAKAHEPPTINPTTADMVRRAAAAARWFDIKEHWVALGVLVSAALALILTLWDPQQDGGEVISPVVVSLAVLASGTTWLAAIVGVLTAAWRAV